MAAVILGHGWTASIFKTNVLLERLGSRLQHPKGHPHRQILPLPLPSLLLFPPLLPSPLFSKNSQEANGQASRTS